MRRVGSARPIAAALAVPLIAWFLVSGSMDGSGGTAVAEDDSLDVDLPVVVYPGPALFDHDLHTDDLELDCIDCHHETDASALRTPHEEYLEGYWVRCASCHRGGNGNGLEPRACVDCHPSIPASVIEETLSAKVVTHLLCADCHDSGTGLDATESCAFCHDEARRRWESRDGGSSEEGA